MIPLACGPNAWAAGDFLSKQNLFETKVPASTIESAISDSRHLIPAEFKIPPELRETVRFWMRIYTEFTSQHVVISDSKHPEMIYEVLDFRDLSASITNPIIYELTVKKRVNASLKRYQKALTYLSRNPGAKVIPGVLPRELLQIRGALSRTSHKHSLTTLAGNLRAQTGQRNNIIQGLMAAEPYFPKMEEIFTSYGLPPKLTRLPLVESSFNLAAKSRFGASGIWQFMRHTGTKFLFIDPHHQIDERLSPLKATVAAAHLLKENFIRFRSWPLTVTAYNHGLRGLTHIKRADSSDFAKIAHFFKHCENTSPLGWAAQNYYAEFLAVLHAETYRALFYGDPPATDFPTLAYSKLEHATPIESFIAKTQVSQKDFRRLNPDVHRTARVLPKGFLVAAPSETENLGKLLGPKARKNRQKLYARKEEHAHSF